MLLLVDKILQSSTVEALMSLRETVHARTCTHLHSHTRLEAWMESAYYRSDKNRYALPVKAHLTPNQK